MMPPQKRAVPPGDHGDDPPVEPRTQPPSPEAEQPTPAAEEGAMWAARRADVELRSRLDRVTAEHRLQVATAVSEYQRTILQITEESAEREAEAVNRMESESQRQAASMDDRLAAAREVQGVLFSGRQSTAAANQAAGRRLAEELQRAWLDARDGYLAAHAEYQRAMQGLLATSAMPGAGSWAGEMASQFAVGADEGTASWWTNGIPWPDASFQANGNLPGGW